MGMFCNIELVRLTIINVQRMLSHKNLSCTSLKKTLANYYCSCFKY